MRTLIIVIVLLLALSPMAGCMPHAAFVNQVDSHMALILPEYQAYIANDPNLDATTRRIRIESAESLRSLVETAKGRQLPERTDHASD